MDKLQIFTKDDIRSYINFRDGETKLGEEIISVHRIVDLPKTSSKFVIIGIPEDYGVQANLGLAGAHTAWPEFLKTFLNLQHSPYLKGDDFVLLGQFLFDPPSSFKIEHLREKVYQIDNLLYPVIQQVISYDKIPIVIGGGHNNAFGMLKGFYLAKQRAVNVINIDAHADLRQLEGRHSGNGFSYAIEQGYLNHYGIFGLQMNTVNQHIAAQIKNNPNIKVKFYEQLLTANLSLDASFTQLLTNIPKPLGLEIDLDSISNVLASAMSPSGFTLDDIRKIILKNATAFQYLHICEGAAELIDGRKDPLIGKVIAYLVSDFAKAELMRL